MHILWAMWEQEKKYQYIYQIVGNKDNFWYFYVIWLLNLLFFCQFSTADFSNVIFKHGIHNFHKLLTMLPSTQDKKHNSAVILESSPSHVLIINHILHRMLPSWFLIYWWILTVFELDNYFLNPQICQHVTWPIGLCRYDLS